MDNLEIREAQPADLPEILQLIEQDDMAPDSQLSESEALELFKKITETGCHKIYVAFASSSLVGTFALILIQSLSHNGGRCCIVEDVVVKSGLQGQGVGSEMMRSAADAACQFGGERLVLSSGTARTQAHAFYGHLGYERDGYRFALNLK